MNIQYTRRLGHPTPSHVLIVVRIITNAFVSFGDGCRSQQTAIRFRCFAPGATAKEICRDFWWAEPACLQNVWKLTPFSSLFSPFFIPSFTGCLVSVAAKPSCFCARSWWTLQHRWEIEHLGNRGGRSEHRHQQLGTVSFSMNYAESIVSKYVKT